MTPASRPPAPGLPALADDTTASAPPGVPVGQAGPKQHVRIEDAYFDVDACRNCGAPLHTPHCGQCGQKRARRFVWRDLRRETWEHWRLFEITTARTVWRLLASPGYVAREYVMGMRKRHMHPLKLLLFVVALLVLVLNTNQFFAHHGYSTRADAQIDRMTTLVQAYANWSFSTGIFAIFLASFLVYRRRLGYNALEHGVLAVYCQILVIVANLLNLLPTLAWNTPDFIASYKTAAQHYMVAVKVLIVGVAFKQFFLVDTLREWPRLVAAILVYAACSYALLRLFAYAILQLVQYQLS